MTMFERLASTPEGARGLAAARLRYRVLSLLHEALEVSPLNQSDLAEKLGIRKSAVSQVLRGDGNVRINTLADYGHALGFELSVDLVPAGAPRRKAQTAVAPADLVWATRTGTRGSRRPAQRRSVAVIEAGSAKKDAVYADFTGRANYVKSA